MGVEHRHSQESNEHYSPSLIVKPAHHLMGGIDLDPASCAKANRVVRAGRFFTKLDNGLSRAWAGRVFLNPPGGIVDEDDNPVLVATKTRQSCSVTGACGLAPGHTHRGRDSSSRRWWRKLLEEYDAGRVQEAIFVGFSLEILQVAQQGGGKSPLMYSICIPAIRLPFLHEDDAGKLVPGKDPPGGSLIAYLPRKQFLLSRRHSFAALYRDIGEVRA